MAIVIVEDLLCSNLMIDDLVFCFLFCFFSFVPFLGSNAAPRFT